MRNAAEYIAEYIAEGAHTGEVAVTLQPEHRKTGGSARRPPPPALMTTKQKKEREATSRRLGPEDKAKRDEFLNRFYPLFAVVSMAWHLLPPAEQAAARDCEISGKIYHFRNHKRQILHEYEFFGVI